IRFLISRRPPTSTLFPYTTLFRSHRQRQTQPHPHCIAVSPDDSFALVPDLGTDRTMVYRIDPVTGRLEGNDPPFAAALPGQGPRSEEHTSELQSRENLVCRLLLEK